MDARYARANDCVTRRIGGETVVVPVKGHVADLESIYTLNDVGTVLWDALGGGATLAELASAVCEAYEVGDAEARADTLAFLEDLERLGLASKMP